jgi:lipopolysaccharide export system protein LptA
MNKFLVRALLVILIVTPASLIGQQTAKVAITPTAGSKNESKQAPEKPGSASSTKGKGPDLNAGVTGPVTTEIYADEAFFDSSKNVGVFRGHVKVNDPRFNLQSDKLTAFIKKAPSGQTGHDDLTGQGQGQGQGLEKAIAEGNVAVVRDRPDPNGGPPSRAVGRADTATYVAATGDVELKGSPRVQQGLNTHMATSPDTVMVINQNGQLTTHGPSRTDIRQEPKDEKAKEEGKAPPK